MNNYNIDDEVKFFFYYNMKSKDLINKISNNYTINDAKFVDSLNNRHLNGKLVTFKNDTASSIVNKINGISNYVSLGKNIKYKVTKEPVEVNGNFIDANIILPL